MEKVINICVGCWLLFWVFQPETCYPAQNMLLTMSPFWMFAVKQSSTVRPTGLKHRTQNT